MNCPTAKRQLATLLGQRGICTWTTDAELRVTSASGPTCMVLGFRVDRHTQPALTDMLGHSDQRVTASRRALQGQQARITVEADGRVYSVLVSPLRDGQAIIGTFGSAIDSTEEENQRELLAVSEQRFREMFNNAEDLIYTHDLQGRFTCVNGAIERMFGYSTREALVMNLTDLLAPEARNECIDRIHSMVGGGTPQRWEAAAVTAAGKRVVLELSARLLLVNGSPFRIDGIARDVTERRMLEEHVRQSQKMEAIGVLAGGIAHDFNNLLTGILGYAYLLQAEPEIRAKASEALEVIVQSAERAAQLTTQLLGFARRGRNQNVPVDVHATIRDLADLLRRTIDKRITITVRPGATNSHVLGDPGQIYQLLLNLCLNSRDAISGHGQITISTRDAGSSIVISVQDTGEGISPEIRQRIFEPFFTTKPPAKGTGMGLAMVYGIARNHGGSIHLESELGAGSTFHVTLPACGDTAASASPKQQPQSGRGRVLVIDDEEIVRQVLSRMLRGLGYEVTRAGDSRQAVGYYEEHWH